MKQMKKAITFGVVFAGCIWAIGELAASRQWIELFNGRNLDGWVQINGTAGYEVQDSMIVGTTAEGSPNSFLCTEKRFRDFDLEFEVKVDPRLNSGVQFRSNSFPYYRNRRVHGYQVEIAASGYSGFIYDEARRGRWLDPERCDMAAAERAFKKDGWNHYRVLCIGNSIQTWINGARIADITDSWTREGFIGLQVHSFRGDPPAQVRWRNIRIKILEEWHPADRETLPGGRRPISNQNTKLAPRTEFEGPRLEFEFPGLSIGIAEYEEGPTGCTVFCFSEPVKATADLRGGAPGTIMTGPMVNRVVSWLRALCFAGGSCYGLESASGVAAEILARGDFSVYWNDIAVVPGAIIYDFHRRKTSIYPDRALGRAAYRAARRGVFMLGARGAGRMASVGEDREPSGQGAAFRQIGPTKIAVFTVVNAGGVIVDRQGRIVRGNYSRETGTREPAIERLEKQIQKGKESTEQHGNTTLTLVITNQEMSDYNLTQLAFQTHSSMARGIQPFHCPEDGDVLFAVTTADVSNPNLSTDDLGVIASELAWDAVLSAVPEESQNVIK